jgi:hypothetical protein
MVIFTVDCNRDHSRSRTEGAHSFCKLGNDTNQAGIAPVSLLLSKLLASPNPKHEVRSSSQHETRLNCVWESFKRIKKEMDFCYPLLW